MRAGETKTEERARAANPRFDTAPARLYHLDFIDPIRFQNEE
jgi:hypothetical protein